MTMTGRSRQWIVYLAVRRIGAFCFLILLLLQPAAAGDAFVGIKPADVTLPSELGAIEQRAEGTAGQPLIFIIGEQHVSLLVQERVADILRYLTGVYDVQLVCTEGYDKPLNVASGTDITVVRRFVASADLAARRIGGLEYFAIANPEVDVIGVEDMKAYKAYGKQVTQENSLEKTFRQLSNDFAKFEREAAHTYPTSLALKQRLDSVSNAYRAAAEQLMRMRDDRDKAMVDTMLRTIKEKAVNSAVLVVGNRHLNEIARLLSEKNLPFVSIVAAGVQETTNDEDQQILEKWRRHEPTASLETLLSDLKPRPASARSTYQDRTAILERLAEGDYLRLKGMSQKETLDFVRTASLPAGVRIEDVFDIEGGTGIAFSVHGKNAYAYFGETDNRIKPPQAPRPIEIGTSGGRHYAIYTGVEPPIPPERPPSGFHAGPGAPRATGIASDDFLVTYKKAITDQRQKRPQRVTILYRSENGIIVRYVNARPQVLFATSANVEDLVKLYREASMGPENVFRAQKLADALLVDVDPQLPYEPKELLVISQDNLLRDISLPLLEAMAGRKDATKLNSTDLITRSYVVKTWHDGVDLSVLGKQVKDTEKAEKAKAREAIERKVVTERVTLKQLLARGSPKDINCQVERLAHSTKARI